MVEIGVDGKCILCNILTKNTKKSRYICCKHTKLETKMILLLSECEYSHCGCLGTWITTEIEKIKTVAD
jgi:hypothetical protein